MQINPYFQPKPHMIIPSTQFTSVNCYYFTRRIRTSQLPSLVTTQVWPSNRIALSPWQPKSVYEEDSIKTLLSRNSPSPSKTWLRFDNGSSLGLYLGEKEILKQ